MKLPILILGALIAGAAAAQTPPADPAEVMGRVMVALAGIDRPPAEVLQAFLPEAKPQDSIIAPIRDLPADLDDPQAVFFEIFVSDTDPPGLDYVRLSCVRFGPSTLAFANESGWTNFAMLLKGPNEGWTGATEQDLPELGSPQAFPQGAILRQDCEVQFSVPPDMPVQPLKDWPTAAIKAIEGQFGTLATTQIKGPAPNTRLGIRASDPKGDPAVQIRLMLGVMPYRPFDDTTLPAFGLELRAATYLFAPPS